MTMSNNNIDVYLSMHEDVTKQMPGVTSAFIENKSAIRELAQGTSYLGSAMLGMSVAMKSSNNAALQGIANMLGLVGGVMTAVGSATHFINAMTRMTSALQKFNIMQAIAAALSGPGGWIKLAAGVAIAGAATYGITKLASSSGGAGIKQGTTIVNQYVAGSIVSQREATDDIHAGLLTKGARSYGTGIK
jgi:hypothetical protein